MIRYLLNVEFDGFSACQNDEMDAIYLLLLLTIKMNAFSQMQNIDFGSRL